MLLISIALCTIILGVQPQTPNPYYLSDRIYFADDRPQYYQDNTRLQQALPVIPLNRSGASVDRENNNEVGSTTSYGSEQQKASGQANGQIAQTVSGQVPQRPGGQIPQRVSGPIAQLAVPNEVVHKKVLFSVTNFGLNLLKDINRAGNVVISPYSITSALALLQQGAVGPTQDQITTALHITPRESATSFAEISADFEKRSARNILKTACNVFVSNEFSINPDFKTIARQTFYSDITPISFSRPEMAARQINNWIASRTNNKIQKLITTESLDSTTQVVLVNAIYFKGLWEIPFRVESTKPRNFHLSNGATKIVPFMITHRYMKAGIDPTIDAKIAILPFEWTQYTLMLILPSPQLGVSGTLALMTDVRLMSYHSFQNIETALHIPKFTVKANIDLVQVLRKMGITNVFGPTADLSRLGTYEAFSPQISSAVHSAVLSIDETGGTAAASTSFAAVALSNDEPPFDFNADRPFIAVVWDEKTSLPLFMARIEDPTQ